MSTLDVLEATRRIATALDEGGFDYAVGGAIALAYWAPPRATVDIDVNVAADAPRIPELVTALRAAGCVVSMDSALAAADRGDFGATIEGIRVDVFLPTLPLSYEAMARRIQAPFGERNLWILSAEDMALFKLIFGRAKDFADLERLLAAQRGRLDEPYLDRWVADLFAPDDSRLVRFRELRDRARE